MCRLLTVDLDARVRYVLEVETGLPHIHAVSAINEQFTVAHVITGSETPRMQMTRLAVLLFLTAILVLGGPGCSTEGDGPTELTCLVLLEADLVAIDMEELPWEWDVDFQQHLECFESVLEGDPHNDDALLMAAFCRTMVTASDEELGRIMGELFGDETRSASHNALFWYLTLPDPDAMRSVIKAGTRGDFVFTDLQDFITDEVLPSLNEVDAYLTAFEELGGAVVLYTAPALPDSTELPDYLEFDVADAYFVHVAVDIMQALCLLAISYNGDTTGAESLEYLIEEDADFLTLNDAEFMSLAEAELLGAADHLEDACDALEKESDDQEWDFITVSEPGWVVLEDDDILGPGAVAMLRDTAALLRETLTEEGIVNLHEFDEDAPDIDIRVSLESLFNDPPPDLRDYMPWHTWSADGDTLHITEPITLPDPEFDGPDAAYGGVFPGMTNETWRVLYEWEGPNWR